MRERERERGRKEERRKKNRRKYLTSLILYFFTEKTETLRGNRGGHRAGPRAPDCPLCRGPAQKQPGRVTGLRQAAEVIILKIE